MKSDVKWRQDPLPKGGSIVTRNGEYGVGHAGYWVGGQTPKTPWMYVDDYRALIASIPVEPPPALPVFIEVPGHHNYISRIENHDDLKYVLQVNKFKHEIVIKQGDKTIKIPPPPMRVC